MQKENPNPTIHATATNNTLIRPYSSYHAPLLGSAAIRRYHLGGSPSSIDDDRAFDWDASMIEPEDDIDNHDDGDSYYPWVGSITAEERSVTLALSAAAYHSFPTNSSSSESLSSSSRPRLEILQQAGFALYHPERIHKQCKAIRYPSFAPSVHYTKEDEKKKMVVSAGGDDEDKQPPRRDTITTEEVFRTIRNIQDPEHPLTLEQLNVVRMELITVVDLMGGGEVNTDTDTVDIGNHTSSGPGPASSSKKFSTVHVQFTPTIPHCSMATLIGLSLRVKLLRSLPSRFKVVVKIENGMHVSEHAVNKQLADKERVRAALENEHLLGVVNKCIVGGMQMQ
jgi:metal-sulfur cluster biosynthetic enzyme